MAKAPKTVARTLVPPRSDLLFRWIFGDQDNPALVTDLLRAALPHLPDREWTDIVTLDPHQLPDHAYGKESVLDVRVTTATGKKIDIEVQLRLTAGIRNRLVLYGAELLTDGVERGQGYDELHQTIVVVIAAEVVVPEEPGYHHKVDLRTEHHHRFTDLLELHILELCRIPEDDDGTDLWHWLRFLAASTEEDMDMAAATNPRIAEAAALVRHYNADETTRQQLLAHEKFLRDQASNRRQALEEGIEIGREQGIGQGIGLGLVRAARGALRSGIPVDEVAGFTGLTPAQVASLETEETSA